MKTKEEVKSFIESEVYLAEQVLRDTDKLASRMMDFFYPENYETPKRFVVYALEGFTLPGDGAKNSFDKQEHAKWYLGVLRSESTFVQSYVYDADTNEKFELK